MTIRAHVHLADLMPEDARAIRATLDTWATDRPHLERPEVLHIVAPAVGEDALSVGDWCRLQRWVACSVIDPTSDDVRALCDTLTPWAGGQRPAAHFTCDPAEA
jgi:hypothetical protein